MIIKYGTDIPNAAGKNLLTLPVLHIKATVLFPGQTLIYPHKKSRDSKLIEESAARKKSIAVVYSPAGRPDAGNFRLCQVGCEARLISGQNNAADSNVIILKGIKRIALSRIRRKKPYLTAATYNIENNTGRVESDDRFKEEQAYLLEQISRINPVYAESLLTIIKLRMEGAGQIADRIAASFRLPGEVKQEILETLDIASRINKLRDFLAEYIDSPVYPVNFSHNSTFMNSKFSADSLSHHLEVPPPASIRFQDAERSLIEKVKGDSDLPDEIRAKCTIEIDRLRNLSPVSAEYGATRQFLDWLLALPWNKVSREDYDLKSVEQTINREYYGPAKVKKRILERIAIRKLSGRSDEASVLCLAGAVGTGKASLTKAIAKALKREFIRIPVGSVNEIDDIKGISRTFISAVPGIIVRYLKNAETLNPVIFLENLDYLTEDSGSVAAMALMEAIDPRINHRFFDEYLGVPIDLSQAFFICSVKSSEDIPEILQPRLEVIELPGYIEKEKIFIARKFIIPGLLKKHGLLRKEVRFNERGLYKIIRNYTLEAGLSKFKQKLEIICRQIAREKAGRIKKIWSIDTASIENFLGTPEYSPEKPGKKPEIGVATGLAWTGMGGDLMIIEGLKMKGSGEVITTGSLGEVMKESIQAAHSYIRSKADILGIDHGDFDNFDIHIHFPSGAIPKDGPSAGVAVCLVIASVMAERPIPNDIAMTGEVTLRGKILQVGGLIEKVSAAYRAGIPTVFIPKANKKDLKDLPDDILKKTRFVFIESVDEVFAQGLKDFMPSSFTLEKLFAAELEKAKNRRRRPAGSIAAKGRRKK